MPAAGTVTNLELHVLFVRCFTDRCEYANVTSDVHSPPPRQLSESQQHQFRLAIETPASGGDPAYRQLLVSLTDGSVGTTSG